VARHNLRKDGYVGGSTRGLNGVDWTAWKDRFHVDKITMAGHSFGAATVVEVLRNQDRFENVQAGIIYDIWGAPIKPPEDDPQHRIHIPILGINSEAFMYWQANFDAVMSLMEEAKEQKAPAFLGTVRGSVHLSQSDFSVLYSHIISFFFKATVNPQRAIDLNISASLEFLRDVTEGAGKSIIQRCLTDEELLQTQVLDQIPDDRKPDDEWIAARLKIKHEFRTRAAASVQRKLKRSKEHGFYNKGDEMWIHCKPDDTELRNWRIKNRCTMGEEGISGDEETKVEGDSVGRSDPAASVSTSRDLGEGEGVEGTVPETWVGLRPALMAGTGHNDGKPSSTVA
jgi:platelet-activating factor acetylhydrolase